MKSLMYLIITEKLNEGDRNESWVSETVFIRRFVDESVHK